MMLSQNRKARKVKKQGLLKLNNAILSLRTLRLCESHDF